jgi:predicted RNA binding protein YcfA (HicA-like mRNA interferase family)
MGHFSSQGAWFDGIRFGDRQLRAGPVQPSPGSPDNLAHAAQDSPALRRAGFVVEPLRGKGSHVLWVHRSHPGISVNLAGHDGDDAHHYQEREVREAIAEIRAKEETAP